MIHNIKRQKERVKSKHQQWTPVSDFTVFEPVTDSLEIFT